MLDVSKNEHFTGHISLIIKEHRARVVARRKRALLLRDSPESRQAKRMVTQQAESSQGRKYVHDISAQASPYVYTHNDQSPDIYKHISTHIYNDIYIPIPIPENPGNSPLVRLGPTPFKNVPAVQTAEGHNSTHKYLPISQGGGGKYITRTSKYKS